MENNRPKEMIRLEEDTPVVVEVGFHNHIVHRRGTQRCQTVKPPHELDDEGVMAESEGPSDVEGHHQ
ncbi:hypothetical protein GOBAR_AA39030 [Gossypium barbadense]|uniref:Uncharacterized protein n=1 Tax=Gossypium barbadense TaxID=3634 RepID=A0A2P5VS86_GOSBA|nr:hypothetical protein GOBAR_AA39030 [Gossypium barbadense]